MKGHTHHESLPTRRLASHPWSRLLISFPFLALAQAVLTHDCPFRDDGVQTIGQVSPAEANHGTARAPPSLSTPYRPSPPFLTRVVVWFILGRHGHSFHVYCRSLVTLPSSFAWCAEANNEWVMESPVQLAGFRRFATSRVSDVKLANIWPPLEGILYLPTHPSTPTATHRHHHHHHHHHHLVTAGGGHACLARDHVAVIYTGRSR